MHAFEPFDDRELPERARPVERRSCHRGGEVQQLTETAGGGERGDREPGSGDDRSGAGKGGAGGAGVSGGGDGSDGPGDG